MWSGAQITYWTERQIHRDAVQAHLRNLDLVRMDNAIPRREIQAPVSPGTDFRKHIPVRSCLSLGDAR